MNSQQADTALHNGNPNADSPEPTSQGINTPTISFGRSDYEREQASNLSTSAPLCYCPNVGKDEIIDGKHKCCGGHIIEKSKQGKTKKDGLQN